MLCCGLPSRVQPEAVRFVVYVYIGVLCFVIHQLEHYVEVRPSPPQPARAGLPHC